MNEINCLIWSNKSREIYNSSLILITQTHKKKFMRDIPEVHIFMYFDPWNRIRNQNWPSGSGFFVICIFNFKNPAVYSYEGRIDLF